MSVLDWNVVVTVRRDYARALGELREHGTVARTGLYNILVMRVPDVRAFLDELAHRDLETISHVVPVTHKVWFAAPEELEERAREVIAEWAPQLAGKTLLVRLHRRGPVGGPPSHEIERRLATAVAPDRMELADPDAVIAIETIRDQGGLALWTREDLARYPFLRAAMGLGHPRTAPAAEPAPSRELLATTSTVTAHARGERPATESEILELLGELEPQTLERLVATGATIGEVAEAVAAIEDEDAFGEVHHAPSTPREAEVRAILEDLVFEDFEERESEIART